MAFLLLAVTSCEDYLETPLPVNSVSTEGAFSSKAVIDKMMDKMYCDFVDNLVVPMDISSWEFLSDNAYNPTTTSGAQDCNLTSNSSWMPWAGSYRAIFMANTMLEGLPDATAVGLDEDTRNAYIGAAKTVRAYAYFMMVRMYGDVPLITDTKVEENKIKPRTAVAEVYAQIESDLTSAVSLLPEAKGPDYYINCKYIPQAILASVYLTQGKWALASAAADAVISSGNYMLDDGVDKVFLRTSTSTIMATGYSNDYTGLASTTAYTGGWQITPMGWLASFVEPDFPALSESLLNSFEPGDRRRTEWVVLSNEGGYPDDNHRLFQYKYKYGDILGIVPPPGLEDDNKFIRLEEMYLIRAEARTRQNQLGGAADDLNLIRNRSGLANTTATTQTALIDAILRERRVEFFFENGMNWFDLLRTGQADAVLSQVPYKANNWKPYMVLCPIPKEDLDINPNLEQNPGW